MFTSKKLNENKNGNIAEYYQLYNGNLSTQIDIYRRFQQNYLKRMEIKNTEENQITHVIHCYLTVMELK